MKDWNKLLAEAVRIDQRIALAKEPDCPRWILETMISHDVEMSVVIAAAQHPSCTTRLKNIVKRRLKEKDAAKSIVGDRDQIILDQLFKADEGRLNHAELHLGDRSVAQTAFKTKPLDEFKGQEPKGKVALLVCPSWGVIFPPYNLARLSAVLRSDNWDVDVYDVNIDSYHYLLETTDNDYWRSERYFYWLTEFKTLLLPLLKPLLDARIDEIVASNPSVVGFSLYNTNWWCSLYMIEQIRAKMPDVVIIAGGPEWTSAAAAKPGLVNFVFVGEAELNLLKTINGEMFDLPRPDRKTIGDHDSKIDLNAFAFPDYSDYDITRYKHPDGVSLETSRGCVAECSFCTETYYWKFRSRTPERVVEEIKDQISKYGINRFWFVDSLVNGNLKNFEKLVDLIIAEKLDIRWNSYARCDGRMTKEFLEKVGQAGCTCLSYGVEVGSEKVLWDMRKKISIWEIEANLQHTYEAGISNHVNWMVGFPTEDPLDFTHSLQLVFNMRHYIHAISPGMGAGDAPLSDLQTNWKTYGLQWKERPGDNKFLGHWWTQNYQNTALHRFIRIKMTAIWLKMAVDIGKSKMFVGQLYSNLRKSYGVIVGEPVHRSEQEPNVNFNVCQPVDETIQARFEASIVNEYIAYAWIMWKNYGKAKFVLRFDPEADHEEFGSFISQNYSAKFNLDVDADGNFSLQLTHEFKHETLNEDEGWKQQFEWERQREEMSFKREYKLNGNFNDLRTEKSMIGEIIHPAYRKTAKVIPIVIQKSPNGQ